MDIIKEALASYGMADASYKQLRQNENIVCSVEFEGKKYVLRIHKPVEGFCISLVTAGMDDVELFRSEADLLVYMTNNGFEGLQQPVKNVNGEYITVLEGNIPVMMLTWIEGEDIRHEDGYKYAGQVGELACRMQDAMKGFKEDRIHYDNVLCDRMIAEIRSAVESEHITADEGAVCIRELEVVKKTQNRLTEQYGTTLIHADLGLYNILVTEKGLIPIDFSLCGYGCLAQEAGMNLSQLHDEESYNNLLEAYRKGGYPIDPDDAEIFLAYSVLLFVCAQHNKMYKEESFKNNIKAWCDGLFIHK